MSTAHAFARIEPPTQRTLLRRLVEGTAGATGDHFFRELVGNLAQALGTHGAWVATYDERSSTLHAIAFVLGGRWVEGYSYALEGTPCETALEERRCVHIPDRIIELYPGDPDLRPASAVSYLGVPLLDSQDRIIGQLAVLDTKAMPPDPEALAVFRIFASRAAAELERIQSERAVREREAQLSRLIDSAMDGIVTLDEQLNVALLNPAARALFGLSAAGADFTRLLSAEARQRLTSAAEQLRGQGGRPSLWLPGGLQVLLSDGRRVEAEATLSAYRNNGREWLTLIVRNVEERLAAERKIQSLAGQTAYLEQELRERGDFDGIVGRSPALLAALDEVERVASTDATVLLLGETGTGKELFARCLHASSPRHERALIRVNCGAIPANLIESELFGHERGAFTGATHRRQGRFALADGGSLLLDEVGELPLELQPKLLRVLQEGEFEPVGSSRTRRVDVRVIAATHRDLGLLASRGAFREDLFYRLNVFPIRIPPLRERPEDIPLLAQTFVDKYAARFGRRLAPLSLEAQARLQDYAWPGNVRELQNVIERGVIVSEQGSFDIDRVLPAAGPKARRGPKADPVESVLTVSEMAELERSNLLRALERTGWKVSGEDGAAALLQMNASTLNSRLRALRIRRP